MSVLVLHQSRGAPIKVFRSPTLVGRVPGCDIVCDDDYVSRHHARFERLGQDWWVEDLGSANGTFINGRHVEPHQAHVLASGDTLRLGLRTEFAVTLVKGASDSPATPREGHIVAGHVNAIATRRLHTPRVLRVFVSYASEDAVPVRQFADMLALAGIDVWLDKTDLMAGDDWENALKEALGGVDLFVACLSRHYVANAGYFHRERRCALDLAKDMPDDVNFIIPVMLSSCMVPRTLRHLHAVDPFEPTGADRLFAALRKRAIQVGATEPRRVA